MAIVDPPNDASHSIRKRKYGRVETTLGLLLAVPAWVIIDGGAAVINWTLKQAGRITLVRRITDKIKSSFETYKNNLERLEQRLESKPVVWPRWLNPDLRSEWLKKQKINKILPAWKTWNPAVPWMAGGTAFIPAIPVLVGKVVFLHLALTNPLIGIGGFLACKACGVATTGKLWGGLRPLIRKAPLLEKVDNGAHWLHDVVSHGIHLAKEWTAHHVQRLTSLPRQWLKQSLGFGSSKGTQTARLSLHVPDAAKLVTLFTPSAMPSGLALEQRAHCAARSITAFQRVVFRSRPSVDLACAHELVNARRANRPAATTRQHAVPEQRSTM